MVTADGVALFRAPMRSRDDAVPDGVGVERGLREGVCGMSGVLERPPSSLRQAVAATASEYDERHARRLERFAAAPDGSFVWTRDIDGHFWLGRIAGPWRYDARKGALAADLVHVRDCRWGEDPIEERRVPAAVTATFARGGRNWQRIRSVAAFEETADL